MPKQKQLYKPNFFFSTLRFFEDLIFDSVNQRIKAERLAYFLYLKDRCKKEIDIVLMKNNKAEIFKLLDAIDNDGNRETGRVEIKNGRCEEM